MAIAARKTLQDRFQLKSGDAIDPSIVTAETKLQRWLVEAIEISTLRQMVGLQVAVMSQVSLSIWRQEPRTANFDPSSIDAG
jgi:hypothetical protein